MAAALTQQVAVKMQKAKQPKAPKPKPLTKQFNRPVTLGLEQPIVSGGQVNTNDRMSGRLPGGWG
jgi:hypothetical protein